MKDFLNKVKDKLTGKKEQPGELTHQEMMAKEKEQATKDGKPWVGVLNTHVNKENIRNGFFELDWNNEFIEQLIDAGYKGESNEEIVDGWFKDIARNVLAEEGLDTDRPAGYIKTDNLGDGKAEVK
jgi:hypothetical protein|tara:strand:- start:1850 stop:2227 length:378 start_codon:yes stop_codon:yes gene_type:complete